jgi:VWFA-related protein
VSKVPGTALVWTLALLLPVSAAPEHVRIATVVTDRQGRAVAGLTLKDFELREDGVVQKIDSVETRAQAPRQIAILLDEFHVDAAETENVRSAVSWFVSTRLRPEDEVVVLKPLDPLTTIRLTDDHDTVRQAIASFDGRSGVYEPRSKLEEDTMGRAPALVETSRAQVVMSALRALTMHLGSVNEGRSAILLVSNGFTQAQHRVNLTGLPDAGIVDRFANRYDVPIYAFDPRPTPADDAETIVDRMVRETGGTLYRGGDLSANLSRAATELDGGYTLTYTPTHGEDGKFHPIQVNVIRGVLAKAAGKDDVARTRAGYVSPLPPELAVTARSKNGPVLSTRMLHKSPLIEVWSGITRIDPTYGHIAVTWLPAPNSNQTVQIAIKAVTGDGKLLFEGFLAPVRVGEPANTANPDRVEFVAPPGRVQIDMTLLNSRGQKLDVDARDIEVPVPAPAPVIFPPILIGTRTAREFRVVAADAAAAPDPAREFRRTDRLVIRVPAYASGKPATVTARLLNRVGQLMHAIDALPETADGITQFDLPLAAFAPGEYFLQFTIAGPNGPVDERVPFKITG